MVTLNIAFFSRWSRLLHQGAQEDYFSRIQQVKSARLDTGVYQTSYLAEWKKKSPQFCQMRSSLIERFQNSLDINLNPKYYLTFYNQINRRLERMANKRIWTAQEDNFLRQQAGVAQNKNWVKISSKLNEIFGGESRSPKQCRQRYINHASTSKENPFSNQWSQDNTKTLFQLYEIYGPRWTTIAHTMTNKSENIVKNKFYCSLRKFTRKLNKFLKSGKNKYKKQIKYQSIIRILDAHDSYSELPETFKNWSCEIRKKVLQLTQVTISDGQIQDEVLDWVTENVNKFNLQTRSYKPKKPHAEETDKIAATISSKSESCRNSSETDEQIFPNNTKPTRGKSGNGKMEEGKQQNNEIIYAKRTCEQNSKFEEILRQENLSQQELIKDFGTAAEFHPDKKNNCEKDLYYEMFSQEFPRFQIDEFLL